MKMHDMKSDDVFGRGSSGERGLRWWVSAMVQSAELILSCFIHTLFGISIFSSAVAADLSSALNGVFKLSPDVEVEVDESNNNSSTHDYSTKEDLPPVVLVHGMFGFGKGKMGNLSYFGGAEKMGDRVFVPDLGSLTSVHDRARQLFYYLKGGRVDFGQEHSKSAGHSQFGKFYEHGQYPEWDEDHPVHLVAHSAGALVLRVFQQMLADKAFEGYETSENWVLSITSLAGALNGCTRTYIDGMTPGDFTRVKPISMFQILRIGVIMYEWMDIGWMKAYFHCGFDHFDISWRKIGFSGLIDCLKGNAGPVATGDWVLADLTLEKSMMINADLKTFPNTFYFSYACKKTRRLKGVTRPSQVLDMHPAFWLRSLQMCQWRFPSEVEPPYKRYRDEDWEDNDGALNTFSMTHPHLPVQHPNRCVSDDDECRTTEPGIWYYKIVEADHMLFVLNPGRAGVRFSLMYDDIYGRCRQHVVRNKTSRTCYNSPTQVQVRQQ